MQKLGLIWARYTLCALTALLLLSSIAAQQPTNRDLPKRYEFGVG